MEKELLDQLLIRYREGNANPDEIKFVEAYYAGLAHRSDVEGISNQLPTEQEWNTIRNLIPIPVKQTNNKQFQLWKPILAIAAAVAFIIIGIQFFKTNNSKQKDPASTYAEIKPGGNGATITLGNGEVINLNGKKSGLVVGQDFRYSDGTTDSSLANAQKNIPGSKTQMLTASTAKGQTYQFTLPDGTKVWLNADSKISFPSQFIEENRKILVSGEAYFEVAKDKSHPFIVETEYQQIEVLGTHFNVNSYPDESSVKTALLEGSVKVTATKYSSEVEPQYKILKPNEQSQTNKDGRITIAEIDPNKVVAWKNGKFIFNEENIESVMRKLSRWYNVEVVYEGDFSDTQFVGSISRSDNISKILDKITFTQAVHFKIEGRRIYVTK